MAFASKRSSWRRGVGKRKRKKFPSLNHDCESCGDPYLGGTRHRRRTEGAMVSVCRDCGKLGQHKLDSAVSELRKINANAV